MEAAIHAAANCSELLNYIKGKKLNEMSQEDLTCILTKFLYPLLQAVKDESIRAGVREEIEEFNALIKGV